MLKNKLKITILSFGYLKSGIPADSTGNGGGFIFDCRGLPNPGRFDKFKDKTGLNKEVTDYLEKKDAVSQFISHTYSLIELTALDYTRKEFSDLFVAFGCTGGQHRSVYCAEKVTNMLKSAQFNVILKHIDIPSYL